MMPLGRRIPRCIVPHLTLLSIIPDFVGFYVSAIKPRHPAGIASLVLLQAFLNASQRFIKTARFQVRLCVN